MIILSNVKFSSIEEALSGPVSGFFWLLYSRESIEYGNKESYYGRKICDERLTFDVSNNKVLANIDIRGTIKSFVTYRHSYPADDNLPGVWWHKDFTQSGPYFYSIQMDGETFDLDKVDIPVKVMLLDNLFPLIYLRDSRVEIRLVVFAPISRDGRHRPPAIFYGMLLKNTSTSSIEGKILLPKNQLNSFVLALEKDAVIGENEIQYKLAPNESLWIPTVIGAVPMEETIEELKIFSSLEWINETWLYFKDMVGDLQMPQDQFTAEFFERAVLQCFNSIGMARDEEISGSNWGSFPATTQIWMKDMYYSFLPFFELEPEFFKKGILWFLKRSVRYRGKYKEGVNHSLSNSLTPAIMVGLYYSVTGDKEFFHDHPEIITEIKSLLDKVLKSRRGELYLFPSTWISDGPSRGDYHAGSNVAAWFSFKSFADIIEDVVGDRDLANYYRNIAECIKRDIDRVCIVQGPQGPQYVEGVNADGTPIFCHDGEESDTTLMPFYGYTKYDDPAYHRHMRVAVTEANPFYRASTKGIAWPDGKRFWTDATFPGYITGLAGVKTKEEWSGPNGRMTIIRRLTDVDGSIWWWPYKVGDSEGMVSREFTGKCGWASGVFVAHFISQILGLSYDARTNTLKFRPFSPSSDFSWKNFRLGRMRFSVEYRRSNDFIQCCIENNNNSDIKAEVEAILYENAKPKKIIVNGEEYKGVVDFGKFFEFNTIKINITIIANHKSAVEIILS